MLGSTRRRVIAFAAAGLIASGLFAYGMTLPLAQRFRGDAVEYFLIGVQGDLGDLLHGVHRTLGFPLLLRAERLAFDAFGVPVEMGRPEAFVDAVVVQLFLFHLAASLGFLWSLEAWNARSGGHRFATLWALPIVFHPGLVFHATVPLTDTFCADLVMLAFAALAWVDPPRASAGREALLGGVAGFLVGYASVARPSYLVPSVCLLVAFTVYRQLAVTREPAGPDSRLPRRLLLLVPLGVGMLLIGTAGSLCAQRHGEPCLQNPRSPHYPLSQSVNVGRDSARMYYSRWSEAPDGTAVVRDPYLTEVWATPCPFERRPPFRGLVACVAGMPHTVAAFLAKKSAGLLDAYHLQPYAVDITPAWVRRLTRVFGALAYAGLIACAVFAAGWVQRGRELGLPACVAIFTVVFVASHAVWHVEGRYGFGALPGAYFALGCWGARVASREASFRRRGALALLFAATVAFFLIQTSAWDRLDPYLARIEGGAGGVGGPAGAVARNDRGLELFRLGRPDEAKLEFEAALRLDPTYSAAHSNLGNYYFRRGQLAEAAAAYREALRLDPGFAQAHNNLGSVHFNTGRLDLAEQEYRRALELNPGLEDARRNLEIVVKARERNR